MEMGKISKLFNFYLYMFYSYSEILSEIKATEDLNGMKSLFLQGND